MLAEAVQHCVARPEGCAATVCPKRSIQSVTNRASGPCRRTQTSC